MFAAKQLRLCIWLCMSLITVNANTVFNKNEKFTKTAQLHSVNIYNSLMSIVTCSEKTDSETTRKCKISLTTLDSDSKSVSCEFVLDENVYEPSGHPFNKNQAVLISQTKKTSHDLFVKYTIVNFPDCKTTEAKINYNSFRAVDADFDENQDAILISEDGAINVFYNDALFCGNKICKMMFTDQGHKMDKFVTSFVPIVGTYRFVQKAPTVSNFIVTELKYGEIYKISLVKPDGQVVLKDSKKFDDWMDHSVSTSHGLIRLCSKTNTTKVDCELFDENGKSTSKTSVDVRQKVETVAVQNLANDEFLLLAENEDAGTLVRVKRDGSVFGTAKLPQFVHDSYSYSKYEGYVDVNNNEYCVTRAGHGHGNLKVMKDCYNDKDLH